MIINDATFLLDESLSGLKKIHDIEELIKDEAKFAKLSEEDKKAKQVQIFTVFISMRKTTRNFYPIE
jgi:hypothetical protein